MVIRLLDEMDGEKLYEITTVRDLTISIIVGKDGTEYSTDDWQSYQPKSFDEVHDFRWVPLEDFADL